MDVRLQKILSGAGVASRRAAEQLMREGRVSVNGQTVLDPGTKADPEHDDVRVDGRRIRARERPRYLLLNKPRGYVTTRSDPQRRPTVLALLEGVREYVYPVGRLDFDSEGLLILTNDGELAARLTHPRHEVPRVYEARVRGVPDARTLARLARGVVIDGRRTAPASVRLVRELHAADRRGREPRESDRAAARAADRAPFRAPDRTSVRALDRRPDRVSEGTPHRAPARRGHDQAILEVMIREGRNRQVRRMCEAVGHPVFGLRRTRIGPIADARLPSGAWRDLTPREVAALKRVAASIEAAHESYQPEAPPRDAEGGSAPLRKQAKHRRRPDAVRKPAHERKVR